MSRGRFDRLLASAAVVLFVSGAAGDALAGPKVGSNVDIVVSAPTPVLPGETSRSWAKPAEWTVIASTDEPAAAPAPVGGDEVPSPAAVAKTPPRRRNRRLRPEATRCRRPLPPRQRLPRLLPKRPHLPRWAQAMTQRRKRSRPRPRGWLWSRHRRMTCLRRQLTSPLHRLRWSTPTRRSRINCAKWPTASSIAFSAAQKSERVSRLSIPAATSRRCGSLTARSTSAPRPRSPISVRSMPTVWIRPTTRCRISPRSQIRPRWPTPR